MKGAISTVLLFLCMVSLFTVGCAGSPEEGRVIDHDLTLLGSTMASAIYNNIMANPEEHIGQTIRVNGSYSPLFYDVTEQYYHYVITLEGDACCREGFEFIWSGDHVYPDDYPEDQTMIEVTGVFDSYDELNITYYYLYADEVSVIH